ncbi:MAG: FAD-dependent monooxygenase [Chitinispirillaceae bacterium]
MSAVMEKNSSSPESIPLADVPARFNRIFRPAVETVDVVVIGAGVAGAYLVYLLAEMGLKAVLLEQIRAKNCPGNVAVSQRTLDAFPFLSVLEKERETGLEVVSRRGKVIEAEGRNGALRVFARAELESFLLKKAAARKAMNARERVVSMELEKGNWEVRTENHVFNCRFVVGADGWNSSVRSEVLAPFGKKDLRFGAGCVAHTSHQNGVQIRYLPGGELLKMYNMEKGSSVGVFGPSEDTRAVRHALDQTVRLSLGAIRPVSPWAVYVPCPSDQSFFSLPASGKNWLLVGEAAGHVNPLTMESVHYSLWSAKLAAQALALGEPRLFDSMWHDEYGRELELAVKMRKRLGQWDRKMEWCFEAACRSEHLRKFVMDLFSSGMEQKTFTSRVFRELPFAMLELAGATFSKN